MPTIQTPKIIFEIVLYILAAGAGTMCADKNADVAVNQTGCLRALVASLCRRISISA